MIRSGKARRYDRSLTTIPSSLVSRFITLLRNLMQVLAPRRFTFTLACLLTASRLACAELPTAPAQAWDTFSDTWVATDALGRSLPTDAPLPRADKTVGIFYFLWQGSHGTAGPFDITKALAANPGAPQLGGAGAFHWWGEPEAGYFRADDAWVIRRNLSMLMDARVDVLFFDVTNAFTYFDQVKALCEQARIMAALGQKPPQIAFITHAGAASTQQKIYDEFYQKNLYPELWYRWKGKPLILGDRNAKFEDGPRKGQEQRQEVKDFFTWRYSWAWDAGPGKWQWIDHTPQKPGLDENGAVEQMPVSVASHPTSNIGRSFQNGRQPPIDKFALTPTASQGLYFQEQWNRALQVDPAFVFVDGWNEWVAQRFVVDGATGPDFLGRPTKKGDTFFVDLYNEEFSRDIEPMRGGYTDSYYYQLVANIRRYKGTRSLPLASPPLTIKMNGRFNDWKAVAPEFRDTRGDTLHRDALGWGDLKYLNTSGRNDIVAAKVARDSKYLYFYARTQAPLVGTPGDKWMLLYLDTDQNTSTGWNGYDLRIGKAYQANRASVERWDGAAWKAAGTAQAQWSGSELELALPRQLSGQNKQQVALDFKWLDNADPDNIESWFTDGDVAPDRRFNFRYRTR